MTTAKTCGGECACKHSEHGEPELNFIEEGRVNQTEGQTVLVESLTLDQFRAWRKEGGIVLLTGPGYRVELDGRVWLPDFADAVDSLMARLMKHEINMFME